MEKSNYQFAINIYLIYVNGRLNLILIANYATLLRLR